MCECLEYEDGSMYLCEVDADLWRHMMSSRHDEHLSPDEAAPATEERCIECGSLRDEHDDPNEFVSKAETLCGGESPEPREPRRRGCRPEMSFDAAAQKARSLCEIITGRTYHGQRILCATCDDLTKALEAAYEAGALAECHRLGGIAGAKQTCEDLNGDDVHEDTDDSACVSCAVVGKALTEARTEGLRLAAQICDELRDEKHSLDSVERRRGYVLAGVAIRAEIDREITNPITGETILRTDEERDPQEPER